MREPHVAFAASPPAPDGRSPVAPLESAPLQPQTSPTSAVGSPRGPLSTRPRRPRPGLGRRLAALLFVLLAAAGAVTLSATPIVQERVASFVWYMADQTPPQVVITAPAVPVRGVITASIAVQDEGPAVLESVLVDGKPVTPTAQVVIDTSALPDGEHLLWVEARDLSRQRNAARARAIILSDNTPPSITVTLDPPVVPQGQTLVVRVTLGKPASMSMTYDGKTMLMVPVSDTLGWGILGIGADAKLVSHTLGFSATDRLGNSAQVTTTFVVTATPFIVEDINLPPDRAGLTNSPEETSKLNAAFSVLSPLPLWHGLFWVPAQGDITAPFGEARSYNGGPVASWHGGVDLAAIPGTPVAAAADGRVVLAEKLTVQGNTVVLDHGMGLTSAYYHMDALRVKPGELVKQGQVVGLVGNTGLSTGAHLHWELRVLGVPVDPWQWTKRAVP